MIRTDVFAVTAAQIRRLDDHGLVELLRHLLQAEARQAGMPPAGIHVPAQITVPDGGEDGRIVWDGGADRTDFLPRRHIAFQAKATNITAASLKAETQVAPTGKRRSRKRQPPVLRPVLAEAIAAGGAYIVATTKPLTAQQKEPLLAAIREGITATGHAPDALPIDIYDANTLAAWATHHQAVALALNERLGQHALSGFKSLDLWGRHPDIHAVPWSDDDQPRFILAPTTLPLAERKDKSRSAWTFAQARHAILDHLAAPRRAVRISGASGLGKSRFAHALFRADPSTASAIQAAAVIYADTTVVADGVVQLANRYADAGSDVVLVVDECLDRVHQRLLDAVTQQGSRLRLITIDVENHQMPSQTVLTVEVGPASNALIETMVGTVDAELDTLVKSYVRDLAQGFPRMAVHGVRAAREGGNPIRNAAELIDRIVWGRRTPDREALRALEVASLFDALRIKGEAPTHLASIAANLAEMSEPRMREHLLSFAERGVVVEKGRFIQVQPIPLAVQLGRRRLSVLGAPAVARFFADGPAHLRSRLLDRLKWLDMSDEAKAFATDLLSIEVIGSLAVLDTDFGARCFDQLSHIVPDLAMAVLDRTLGSRSIDELKTFSDGRRHIVWALERLVFRRQTFGSAARLLLRLAAAETEPHIGNNATGEFKRLFQRDLSGTEAEPAARLAILDDGLAADDPTVRRIAIDAADVMLETGHFSRSGSAEVIGSQTPLRDWSAKTWNEVWDFHMAGLERLAAIATGTGEEAVTAQKRIGNRIRGLLWAVPFDRLLPELQRVAAHIGLWPEAIRSVSDWLFFDRRKHEDQALAAKVRAFYDALMPADLVDRALLFAAGWTSEIHDPDTDYDDKNTANNDLYYSDRMVASLGEAIATAGIEHVECCLEAAVTRTLHSGFLLGNALAKALPDPLAAFRSLIDRADRHGALADDRFLRGFIAALDARDATLARACVDDGFASTVIGRNATSLMQGLALGPADVPRLVALLEQGRIRADFCAHLSYGRGLDNIAHEALGPFLDALIASGPAGAWSALQIIAMVLHGRQELPAVLAHRAKIVLASDDLFRHASRKTSDAHLVSSELARLAAHDCIDADFARLFVRNILAIPDLEHALRYDFEHYADEMLACLITKRPDAVWTEIASRLETATGVERWRLDRLLAPDRHDRSSAGVLFRLPQAPYLDWVRQAPDTRAPAIAEWLPLVDKDGDGNRIWHPALMAFVEEFADVEGMLPVIGSRLRPTSWWGSLVPYLEPWLPLIEQWRRHRNPAVRRWADTAHRGLLGQIEAEQQDDAEREVSIW